MAKQAAMKLEHTEMNEQEKAQLRFLYLIDLGLFLFLIFSYSIVTFMTRGELSQPKSYLPLATT